MSAFLKIDQCQTCSRALPWEWVPAVLLNGRALAGTGVWRSALVEGCCAVCVAAAEAQRQKDRQAFLLRHELVSLLGGEKPYREFTFERFKVTPENGRAFEHCCQFNPAEDSLYLWGPCGVGKTHLAWAVARKCFEETLSVAILPSVQISRRVRMREPDQEQAVVDDLSRAAVLVVDDLGNGPDTAFGRQILQEVLDARDFNDRHGLVVTSQYSLDELASKLGLDAIPSRLAGLCSAIEIRDRDHRLSRFLPR
jgi:DNA replication protein DnaC